MIRRAQHLRSLVGGVNDRYGRLAPPVMPPLLRSREKSGSTKSRQCIIPVCIAKTYFVISDKVVRAHALDLRWAEHPADIVNDFDIGCSCL